jgi:hypothetical protein
MARVFMGRTSRQRKIWFALVGTVLGTAALTGMAVWVDASRQTDFRDLSTSITAIDLQQSEVPAPPLRFRDIAQERGVVMRHGPGPRSRLLPEDTGSGLAWGDYDGDGRYDLYIVNFPDPTGQSSVREGSGRLFHNDGDHFTDVTERAGVANAGGFGMGATWVDYDNDGHLDLFVTNYGGPNRLYHNRGDGTFEEVAAKVGLAGSIWSTGAAWGDFDRDGNIDLYVCNYVQYNASKPPPGQGTDRFGAFHVPFTLNPNAFNPAGSHLYRNRGDGTFEDVTEQYGVANAQGRGLAATWIDLDGDGWLDLFVANDVSPNKLYRNRIGTRAGPLTLPSPPTEGGEGRVRGGSQAKPVPFEDLSAICGVADDRGSMGISVGETGAMNGNYDGLPDLFITHWIAQEDALYQSARTSKGFVFYKDKARQLRLGEISNDKVGWGCAFADFDLDGRPDLVVANGSTLEEPNDFSKLIPEPLFLFWNDGKCFRNLAPTAGEALQGRYCARGLAVADFDDDGLPDIAVSVNRGAPLLLHNESKTPNRGLKIRLKGRAAALFGARVEVLAGDRRQVQWYGADVSYLSMHAPELIFGLGERDRAEQVQVTWADGKQTTLTNVPAGKTEIVHADPYPVQLATKQRRETGEVARELPREGMASGKNR